MAAPNPRWQTGTQPEAITLPHLQECGSLCAVNEAVTLTPHRM